MPIIFGGMKRPLLGALKAQLPFSKSNYQLLNSWNKIPFLTIFDRLNFQINRIRTDQIVLAPRNIALN